MKHIWTFIAILVALATLTACGKKDAVDEPGREAAAHKEKEGSNDESAKGEEGHAEDVVLSAEAAKIAGIEIATARTIPMLGELKVPGTVTTTSQGRAIVTPPVGGKITRLYVKVGDRVRAGQPIATIQSADLAQSSVAIIEAQRDVLSAEASVREARAQVNLANSRLRTARQVLERQREFARTGAFSQPALQAAQREVNEGEAELESAKQDQAVHEAQLERAERLFKQELISFTELEQARLTVQQDRVRQQRAAQQIELARATYEREKRIAERGLLNSREIQAAEAEVRAANLEVQQAKIRHASAQASVGSANKGVQAARAAYAAQAGGSIAGGGTVTVVAPIGGVVTEREATLGQAVERTTEICEIENLQSVWVTANVSDKQIGLIKQGSRAEVSVAAFPGRTFPGVIQVVGSRLDPKSRTMPAQVLVDNSSGALRTDMFATVTLGVGTSSMALAVPRTAITEEHEGRPIVFIEEAENRYMRKPVELGRRQGDLVEIVRGLEPGAKVVTKGAFVLMSQLKKGELKGDED